MLAIHEAGHLVVAVATGVRGRAWIFPSGTLDPINERTWGGKFDLCFDPTFELTEPMAAVIGAAGVVAECWSDDPLIESWEILDWIDLVCVEPSATDLALMGVVSEDTISKALELLRGHREFFDWAVTSLLEDKVIPDGLAWDKFLSEGK